MNEQQPAIETILRIPGRWSGPDELFSRLPDGFHIEGQNLILPDGVEIECSPMPRDDQFANVFRGSCRRPASPQELAIVDDYSVNICLAGPGGSLAAARTIMQAGAAILQAGAGGVFIDNSGLSHGASAWLEMAETGDADALSYAFVGIVRGRMEVWTMGMHVLGKPDLVMPRADADADQDAIIETLRYVCTGEKPIDDGHILVDEHGPRYQIRTAPADQFNSDSPMHNPFGRLKLVSYRSIAEQN